VCVGCLVGEVVRPQRVMYGLAAVWIAVDEVVEVWVRLVEDVERLLNQIS